jgi:Rha family phage regulatory protein
MKELIPMNDYGIFADGKDTARANSLIVAKMFEKNHRDVLRAIKNIECSDEFRRRNFAQSSYINEQNKKQPCVMMTRDGFTFLAMGFTGKKAAQFKEAYIKRFNEMEKLIFNVVTVRKDYPMLTEAVKMAHDEPKPYHFSNEADLLNKIITGYTAKKFRELHNIPKGESIRPFLTDKQLELMELLQKVDTGLLIAVPDYEQRKRHLEWYKLKWEQSKIKALTA